jgi:hypothetical protein
VVVPPAAWAVAVGNVSGFPTHSNRYAR